MTSAAKSATAGAEGQRLSAARETGAPWRKWGPYLSERQWGPYARTTATRGTPGTTSATTRHDRARIDGARTAWRGSLTDHQQLCFLARAVERQGSHHQGASVRADEQRGQSGRTSRSTTVSLDSTPTHSYMKNLRHPGGLPVRRARQHQTDSRPRRPRVRARYRRLRAAIATSTSSSEYAKETPKTS